MKYKCVIVDDEGLARGLIEKHLSHLDNFQLIASCESAIEANKILKDQNIDLLFLDINMDELSGIELLESSKINAQVIITTAYQEYAIKGYELNVTDYLLKPFSFNRFLQAVGKAQVNITKTTTEKTIDFIFVKTENRLEKIILKDIVFIEGMRDYRRIHTIDKKIMTLQNFKELEQLIPSALVCRVHKSYMVSLGRIDSVERSRIKIGKEIIPISDTYRELFFQKIKNIS